MPDVTVSANVDTMMRAANNAAIRSAIGLGQTDAPTFLAQSLTGNGSNTSPSLKVGAGAYINGWYSFNGLQLNGVVNSINAFGIHPAGTNIANGHLSFGIGNLKLEQDADNILAQRNGVNAQAFRVANSVGASPLVDYDRGTFGFPAGTNTLRIGTENGGTYTTARGIDFVVGGTVRFSILNTGVLSVAQSLFVASTLKGNLTTNTAYTATTVVPTGYITIYDSTNTPYRVPCVL